MNGPNLLSLIRLLLGPAVAAAILAGSDTYAIVLLGVALATDFLDGWWARHAGLSTELGRVLDPLADKVLVAATLVALLLESRVPRELAFLVLLRDATLLTLAWLRIRGGGAVPAAELPGKVGFSVLGGYVFGIVVGIPWPSWVPAFVGALYLITGATYAKRVPGLQPTRVLEEER